MSEANPWSVAGEEGEVDALRGNPIAPPQKPLKTSSILSPPVALDPSTGAPMSTEPPKAPPKELWRPSINRISITSVDTGDTVFAQYHPKEIQIDRTIPWQQQISPDVNKLVAEFSGEEPRSMSLDLLFDGYEEGVSVRPEIEKLEHLAQANVETDGPRYMITRNADGSVNKKADRMSDDALGLDEIHRKTFQAPPKLEDRGGYFDEKMLQFLLDDQEYGYGLDEKDKRRESVELRNTMDKERVTKGLKYKRPHWCAIKWGNWLTNPLEGVIENISVKYLMFGEDGTPLRALVTLRIHEALAVTMATSQDIKTQAERLRIQRSAGTVNDTKLTEVKNNK